MIDSTVPPPVLVTGSHRSGSTWVGRLLASAEGLHYVQEPFNIVDHHHWFERQPPQQFLYLTDENAAEWVRPMERVLELRYPLVAHVRAKRQVVPLRRALRVTVDARRARRRGERALMKDPIALFSVEWLVRRFDMVPVILVRDPVAFVGSLKERGWSFDFRHWMDQPLLMRDHLGHLEREIAQMIERPAGIVEQGILQWNAFYGFVDELRRRHPEFIVVHYEKLASDPAVEIEQLFGRLGLDFGEAQLSAVEALSTADRRESSPTDVRRNSAKALETWRDRLTAEEVDAVREATAAVHRRFE